MHNFTHNSFCRFIRNFKIPLLFNRNVYVNMGEYRGGLFFLLDGTVLVCVSIGSMVEESVNSDSYFT